MRVSRWYRVTGIPARSTGAGAYNAADRCRLYSSLYAIRAISVMSSLVLLSGSLRRDSLNTRLARNLADLAPADCHCEVVTPAGIPLYDGDAEDADGVPDAVERLKDRVAAAAGLVLITPEYNQGVPGVLKNTIDWMSRPPGDRERVFAGRPVAVCGATPGGAGTRTAQYAWLPVFRGLGMQCWAGGSLFVAGASQAFDADGRLADDAMRQRAADFIAGFSAWAVSLQTLGTGVAGSA